MYICQKNPSIPAIDKKVSVKVLHVLTQEMFLYKNNLYKQIDGIAMGSLLGPTLANFFMVHMKNTLIDNRSNYCSRPNSKLYLLYMDDIFAIFDNQEACSKFLKDLNRQQHSILP